MSSKNSLATSDGWEDVDDPEKWTDIFDNNDLKRRVIAKPVQQSNDEVLINSEGTSQSLIAEVLEKPKNGDIVKIRVSGYFLSNVDGLKQEIDKFDQVEFEIGLYDVIEAWELAVQLMVKGEIDEIKTSARFAYGNAGRDPEIQPNTSITYTIELLSIESGIDIYELGPQQRNEFCEKRKDRGNYYFKREEYNRAVAVYQKGISAAECAENAPGEYEENLRMNLMALYNNLAMVALKLNNWSDVLEATEKCLSIDPKNAKAMYRRAKAFEGKEEYENALVIFENIVELKYDIKDVKIEIIKCKENIKRDKERMKRMCGRMIFGDEEKNDDQQWSTYLRRTSYAAAAGFAAVSAALAYRFMYK